MLFTTTHYFEMDEINFNGDIMKWRNIPSIPIERYIEFGVSGAAIDSHRMIVIERRKENARGFLYDIREQKWMKLQIPPPQLAIAAASIDGKLITLHAPHSRNETNEVHLMNIDDMTWRELPSAIHTRYDCALVSHGRHVYAFGGFCSYYKDAQRTAERLNIDTLQWESLPDMPTARAHCTASACQGKIIIAGGYKKFSTPVAMDVVEVFDTRTMSYSIAPSMPIKCYACSSVSLGKHVIVTGGQIARGCTLGQTQVFDCELQVWKVLPCLMNQRRAYHVSALLRKNHLIIAGGRKHIIKNLETAEKIVLPLSWSLKGQIIILRYLIEKDRTAYYDATKVKDNLMRAMKSGCYHSNACEKIDSDEEDLDQSHFAVSLLVSKDFPFDVFKLSLNFLQNH